MRRLMLGLPALLLLACDPATDDPAPDEVEPLSVDLAFAARVGGAPAACGVEATLGTSDTTGALADARLFLSTIQLRDADSGDWVDIELSESIWQQPGLALLDFEDGTGACADSGTSETNSTITGTVPDATYDAVRFDVGVPFESNHLDSAQAPAPLNAPGMFWAWQSGYKFVRVDWAVTGGEIPRWNVHIGAGGCESAAPTVGPAEPCARPNLSTVTLEGFDPTADTIALDLDALVADADVAVNTMDSPPGCMSSPVEPTECDPVYASLGLDFVTGDCTENCDGQALFAIE